MIFDMTSRKIRKGEKMLEKQKNEIATFRFGVICDFVNNPSMGHGHKEALLKEKCARKWSIPFSDKTRLSRSTIRRWIALYKSGGNKIEALFPKNRCDTGKSRTMDEETGLALISVRKEFPNSTVKKLINIMNERNLVTPGINLNLSKVYRFLHKHDLMNRHNPVDRRKFEAELPNDLWQADVMHGPQVKCNGKLKKTYLIAIIDDYSRMIVHGEFYYSEKLSSWLHAFEKGLLRRGLPRKLFVDNGAAFRSKHFEQISASLGIALIHSRPYCPQGKGKIERWFKTVRSNFLSDYKLSTLDRLNEDIKLWIDETYNQRKHGSTGQKPLERFVSNTHCLRIAPKELKNHFRKKVYRRVASDRTVSIDTRLFEAPVALIKKRVTLLYHEDNPEQVEVIWDDKSYGIIRPVDVHVNCRVKRDRNSKNENHTDNRASYQSGQLWNLKGGKEDE
jgi:transposase InsO family protein